MDQLESGMAGSVFMRGTLMVEARTLVLNGTCTHACIVAFWAGRGSLYLNVKIRLTIQSELLVMPSNWVIFSWFAGDGEAYSRGEWRMNCIFIIC